MEIFVCDYEAPCGRLVIGESEGAVCMCDWNLEPRHRLVMQRFGGVHVVERQTALLSEVQRQLDAYFAGELKNFNLPLKATGTEFRQRVWNGIMEVPYGCRLSYGELSRRLGMPLAVRAVASAAGANPMSILIPCHRIVGAGNNIGGYAGGVAAKEYLLGLELSARVRE